ncbi:hypothetical protein Aduo_004667 [Ancylostoma duodenale]
MRTLLLLLALTTLVVCLPKKCRWKIDPGRVSCARAQLMFGYDKRKKKCVQFFYNGSGGNHNRFKYEHECIKTCVVKHGNDESQWSGGSDDFGKPMSRDKTTTETGKHTAKGTITDATRGKHEKTKTEDKDEPSNKKKIKGSRKNDKNENKGKVDNDASSNKKQVKGSRKNDKNENRSKLDNDESSNKKKLEGSDKNDKNKNKNKVDKDEPKNKKKVKGSGKNDKNENKSKVDKVGASNKQKIKGSGKNAVFLPKKCRWMIDPGFSRGPDARARIM